MKQMMTRGIGDEVTLGSLHSKLAMGLVKSKPGLVEVLVTECAYEAHSRELVDAELAPYL